MIERNFLRLALIVTILTGCVPRQPANTIDHQGFVEHVYRDSFGRESTFAVFVPRSYNAATTYPAILFLHGAGQTGDDGKVQHQRGLGDAIRKQASTFPFITIFPQSHQGTWVADSQDGRRALAILDLVEQLYQIDRQRIYLTGYSMGGEGTWSLAAAEPDRFAAIIPICPGKNLDAVSKLKDKPIWCFQGGDDDRTLVQETRSMMLAIKKAGGRPMYQEYPGVEHNCWDITYQNDEVFEWLLEQKRRDLDVGPKP